MKWGTYKTEYEKTGANRVGESIEGFYSRLAWWNENDPLWRKFAGETEHSRSQHVAHYSAEWAWCQTRRPYFKLWPGLAESLLRTNLNVAANHIPELPVPALVVLLPECIQAVLQAEAVILFSYLRKSDSHPYVFVGTTVNDGRMIRGYVGRSELTSCLRDNFVSRGEAYDGSIHLAANPDVLFRLYVGLCLLASNPEMIEPEFLDRDKARAVDADRNGDHELLARLAERARQRGKFGWTIGRRLNPENSPHVRIPHLATYWMGHGENKTATLRPRKGCVVNRKKMTDVPTGFLDDGESQ